MVYGRYQLLLEEHPQLYAFTWTLDDDRLLVLLNFLAGPLALELPAGPEPRRQRAADRQLPGRGG